MLKKRGSKAYKFYVKQYTPIGRVSDNGTGVDKIRVYDDTTLRPVQRGHLDAILHRVRPEHGSSQVVDGDTLRAVHICWGYILHIGFFALWKQSPD